MSHYLKAGEFTRKGDICHCADGRDLKVSGGDDEMTSPGYKVQEGHEIFERLDAEDLDKPYRLELELKGLSPTSRDALIKAMEDALDRMSKDICSDLSFWDTKDSSAREEMEGWERALSDVSMQIFTQKRAWPKS